MARAILTFILLLIAFVIAFRREVSVFLVELIWKLEDIIEEQENKKK
jgi:hypothetical protein